LQGIKKRRKNRLIEDNYLNTSIDTKQNIAYSTLLKVSMIQKVL